MPIERLFDAVERRDDIGRRVAALVLPIPNRPRVTSSCAGKIGLREPGEHTSGPNLASRDNVAHNCTLYTILETPPPVIAKATIRSRCCPRPAGPLAPLAASNKIPMVWAKAGGRASYGTSPANSVVPNCATEAN